MYLALVEVILDTHPEYGDILLESYVCNLNKRDHSGIKEMKRGKHWQWSPDVILLVHT